MLAKATGRPVRLQYMRDQGTGWDPKAPASIHRARAAIDADGNVIAYDFLSKGFSRLDVVMNESKPADTLAGHVLGAKLTVNDGFGVPAEVYEFANKRVAWETIAPLLDRASPLRTAHLRDPVGPQIHFAWESFMDEVAHAVGADPVEFRLRHLKSPRDIAVIKAAAERAGWQTRTSPRRDQTGSKVSGAASRIRSATARSGGGRRGRHRPHDRQNLGAQVHGRARLRADHQSGRPGSASRATSCRAPAARCGRRCTSTSGGDQRRLDDLSDPRHQRDAGEIDSC